MQQDINVQLIVKSPTEGWTPLIGYPLNGEDAGTPTTSTLLLSDNDPHVGRSQRDRGYHRSGERHPFRQQQLAIRRTGRRLAGPYQFQVLAWTGAQYTSYAAAVGQPNTYTGRSAVFSENTCYANMLPLLNQGWLGNMSAIILQPQLPGDANGDGKVDINDLTIVLSNFGQTGMTWSTGDFNGDGKVDVNDLTILLSHFGQTAAASGLASPSAVPEPSTLALSAVARCSAWRPSSAQVAGGVASG